MDKHTVTSIHIHCNSWYKRTTIIEKLSIYTTQVALYLIIHVFGAQALKCQQTVFCTKPDRRSRSLLLSFRKVQEEMGRRSGRSRRRWGGGGKLDRVRVELAEKRTEEN